MHNSNRSATKKKKKKATNHDGAVEAGWKSG